MKLVGSKSAIRSPEFHKQKVIRRWLIAITTILILVVVVAGPIFLLRYKKLRIAEVNIVGNDVAKTEDIEKIIASDLSGNYLYLIPKDSIIFYPKHKIENELLGAMPRLASVGISLASTHSIKVSIVERQPHALYCDQENMQRCYFLDETGYIFAPAPDFSDDVYMKYATNPALSGAIRTQLFEPEAFKTLEKFLARLKTLNLEPEMLTKGSDEYDLNLRAGPVIKWSANQDLDTLYVNIDSFINNSGLTLPDIETMQYIDLRFDNKVFYK